jgi:hypothetical protein
MPPGLQGHRLQYDGQNNRKCLSCGMMTKSLCGCGRAFCGISKGVTCWADNEPVRWQTGERIRRSFVRELNCVLSQDL